MRFRAFPSAVPWILSVLLAPIAGGQPSFHVSVNLVQVDAVVTDSKGRHIRDLEAEDFEVTEDGKPQKITKFAWIAVEPSHAPAAGGLQNDEVRRSIVLMMDDSGPAGEEETLSVMKAARNFVSDQMAPGDLVSVTASRGGMGFYQQFTSEKRQLYAAIDHLAHRPGFGQWNTAPPEVVNSEGKIVPLPLRPGEPPYHRRDGEAPNPIGHLTWAIQGLRNVPGRKAVVLFSHSFSAPASLVDLANRSGVVIYVIDPHGMNLTVDQHPTPNGYELDVASRVTPSNAPYRLLAAQTGGLYLRSAPGASLSEDLGRVLEDLSGYYLLGYQASRSEAEMAPGRKVRHAIQVRVRRPGLMVRARNGNLGAPGATAAAPVPRTTDEFLQQALFSPFSAGKIRLRVDPTFAASPPDPRTKQRQPVLRAMLEADAHDLQFHDAAGGKKELVYSVLVALFNQEGTQALSRGETFRVSLTPEEAAVVMASGLKAVIAVKLERAGPYQLRAAVRDENSGDVGSAYTFLEAPDFNRPQIALSGIELSVAEGESRGAGSGRNEYPIGTWVHFECEVFGFRTAARPPAGPRVEMEVRLFREGQEAPVYDSRQVAAPAATLKENFLAGRLRIASDFEPGAYVMQLVAYDRLATSRKQIATQWTNLTVVKR